MGGQTGVDRAALDVALELGISIGGHLPRGRTDENGDALPDKYVNMQETDNDDVNLRTELNVQDSDATLVFSHGILFGGSEYTQRMARKHGKPCLHIDFEKQDTDRADALKSIESQGPVLVYYSFVTMTTVGYGDITPISPPARTMSWLEAMMGQF